MGIIDRLKSFLGSSAPVEAEDTNNVTVTNLNTGETRRGDGRLVVKLPEVDTRQNSPSSSTSAVAATDDDLPDGDADLAPRPSPRRAPARARPKPDEMKQLAPRAAAAERDRELAEAAARATAVEQAEEEEDFRLEADMPEGDIAQDDLPDTPEEELQRNRLLGAEAQRQTEEEQRLLDALTRLDESAPNPSLSSLDPDISGIPNEQQALEEENLDDIPEAKSSLTISNDIFSEQLKNAIDAFIDNNSKTKKRTDEISKLSKNTQLIEAIKEQNSSSTDNAITALGVSLASEKDDEFVNKIVSSGFFFDSQVDKFLATYLYNKDIRKLFYYNQFSSEKDALLSTEANTLSTKKSLQEVALSTGSLLRYASDKEVFPTFILDQKLYIQGVNVGLYLKGNVSVSKNSISGHNTLTFTLDNSNDRFVWTDRNLGSTIFGRDYFYDEHGNKVDYYDKQKLQKEIAARFREEASSDQPGDPQLRTEVSPTDVLSPFLQYEDIKAKIFEYKANPNVNPIGIDAAGNKMFTRFDLVPNKCIFNRMDPIRLFTLYPFRPRLGNETSKELWMPEFAGFIENVSIEDDDVLGTSTITIECADIRQSILTRMRISSSVSSSLTNPLEQLGLKPLAIYDEGPGGTNVPSVTAQQRQIIDEVRQGAPRFFNQEDRTVTFYDDVVNSVYGTPVPPNLNIEGTVRELLEFKLDALSAGRARRGVNNIEYGGTFRTPWGPDGVEGYVEDYLESYHLFTLFGPKRRPWTPEEVDYVGKRTVTTDPSGVLLGDFTPLNCRLWFLFPKDYTGPANLAELTTANVQMSHEASWTNRIEVLRNVIEGVDYHLLVSGTGDIHVEFPFADFRPEDFGLFKDAFRFKQATISTSYSDEAEEPVAGLIVVTGYSAGAPPLDEPAESFLQKTFAFSPYIAARYGMNVTQTISIPYLEYKDQPIAQQRAVIELQKANAKCNTLQFQSAFRPFLLPNRPVHHLRRSRMGIIVSCETTFEIGASPRASISVGLEHVRTWTGGYRFEAKPPVDAQSPTEFEKRLTKKSIPADQKGSVDPYTQQVFTSVMAGTNLPTSNRAVWEAKSPVVANSGVFVINLQKFTEEQISKDEPPAPTPTPQDTIPAPENATPASVVAPPEPEDHKKWTSNPLRMTPLDLTSYWQPVRVLPDGSARPHEGIDFGRSGQDAPEVIAVNDGSVIASEQRGFGHTIVLDATKENGLKALYGHLGPIRMIPKSNFPDAESGEYDKAQALAKDYAIKESEYRDKAESASSAVSVAANSVTSTSKKLEEAKKEKDAGKVASLERDLAAAQKKLTDAATALNTITSTKPAAPSSKYYMTVGVSYPTKSGEVIGFMSNSGGKYPVHLHFETHDKNHPVVWPYDYSELLQAIGYGSQLKSGSIEVNPYTYLPGPINKPNKTGEALDAFVRGRLEELKEKISAKNKK